MTLRLVHPDETRESIVEELLGVADLRLWKAHAWSRDPGPRTYRSMSYNQDICIKTAYMLCDLEPSMFKELPSDQIWPWGISFGWGSAL